MKDKLFKLMKLDVDLLRSVSHIRSSYSENMYLSEKDKAKQGFKYLKKNTTLNT